MRRPGRVLLLLSVLLGGCVTAPATTAPSGISVRATGRASVKPDTVFVNVGVEARDPTLAAATADVGRRMTAVLARVKALGVAEADIATVGYAVDPIPAQRRNEEEPIRIVGYRVSNVVRVRIRDVAAAGRIVDGAVAEGANTVSALQFTINDSAPAEREARAQAVALAARAWDPYPFILLNLFLSMLAAVQAPVIMMSQNRQDARDRLRSELDFSVNRKAEGEIIQLAARLTRIEDKLDDIHRDVNVRR